MKSKMKLKDKPKNIIAAFFYIIIILLCSSCGGEKETAQTRSVPKHSDGFTFFDIGKNSIISKDIRKELNKKLGDDAVEGKNIINLEINYKGFLKEYFPVFDNLNQQLNFPPDKIVQHRTIKLMYRYARKKDIFFDYVEFIFLEDTKLPVLIRIDFKKDYSNIIETLKQKYGSPKIINLNKKNEKSLYWGKNSDLLILSCTLDRFGKPKYQIMIYFTENMNKLLKSEQIKKEKERQKRTKSEEAAF